MGFPGGLAGKESACQCGRCKRDWFESWVGKIPWRRKWQPTPVFLPEKFQGQRSLVGYSPWGHKESMHEWHTITEIYSSYLQRLRSPRSNCQIQCLAGACFLVHRQLCSYCVLTWWKGPGGPSFIRALILGLSWWSSGLRIHLPMQGTWV